MESGSLQLFRIRNDLVMSAYILRSELPKSPELQKVKTREHRDRLTLIEARNRADRSRAIDDDESIESPNRAGLRSGRQNEGTPPNALIDHWPAACNRLDSLGFRVQQRMLI
jgi:hypothetical protein